MTAQFPAQSTTQSTKLAYRSETGRPSKVQFFEQRKAALSRERAVSQGRLDTLRAEIRKIISSLEHGTASDQDKAFATLERMGKTEAKLVEDIVRLTTKIG